MDAAIAAQRIPCSVPGCTKFLTQAGVRMCGMHLGRLWKTGSVGPPESHIGPRGEGTIDDHGYRRIPVNGKHRYEHHVVIEAILGRSLWPWENVHHKNATAPTTGLRIWSFGRGPQPAGQRVEDLVAFVGGSLPR